MNWQKKHTAELMVCTSGNGISGAATDYANHFAAAQASWSVRIQKMLWPESNGICHAIIVHPPAGIAGGDHLTFDMQVDANAHAL